MSKALVRKQDTIAVNRVREIVQLHQEIGEALRTTLPKAIRIGKLLAEQKAELRHGEWLPWLKKNLPFSERTAQDYLRFYARRGELKSAMVADLPGARAFFAVGRAGDIRAELARPVSRALVKRGRGPVDPVQLFLDATRRDVAKMTLLERLRAAAGILAGR